MFQFTRRDALRSFGCSALGAASGGWMTDVARAAAGARRHCILLWMSGGPSQIDTFDLKPGHVNGGPFREIATSVPGVRISEHLHKLAKQMERLAILRGLSTKEGDHGRGTYLMHTGHVPGGPIRHPTIGSSLSKHLADAEVDIPAYVSVAPYLQFNATGAGFLGAAHAPLTVGAVRGYRPEPQQAQEGFASLQVDDVQPSPIYRGRERQRHALLESLQEDFSARHPDSPAVRAHRTIYERADRFLNGGAVSAFNLDDEPRPLREAYGRGRFGQGCLLARRLIEKGVAFVEVSLGYDSGDNQGWDTHSDNFNRVKSLSAQLDAGWSTLMTDLADRGLLDSTTILWMGEFGRTPAINRNGPNGGRDHFTDAWTAVLAGGGIKGGQAYGKTSVDGQEVVEGKIDIGDLLATFAAAAGVPPTTENTSELGRPIKVAEGRVIAEVTG